MAADRVGDPAVNAGITVAVLIAWAALIFTLSPWIGARLAGRPMTTVQKELVAWSGLGLALALFILASLWIGARP